MGDAVTEPEWEPSPAGRLLIRLLGADRTERLIERGDRWLLPPQGADRCPWIAPLMDSRCTLRVGHRSACHTEFTVTNKQNGKSRTVDLWWRGVNYDVD
jgi:hypothetical protein